MAIRYRWLRINSNFDLDGIIEKISAVQFSRDADEWFSLEGYDNGAKFFYYWRTAITTSYIDESKMQVYQSVPTLASLEFSILKNKNTFYVRIKNPPRTVAVFMGALEKVLGFGFWAENVDILIKGKNELLRRSKGARLVSIKATNIKLGDNVIGRVEAVSKESISEDLLGKFSIYSHLIDICSYEIIQDGVRGQVSFHRNGQVKVTENISGYVIQMIEDIL